MPSETDPKKNLITDEAGIAEIARSSKRIAVLGIKTEGQEGQAAFDVPQYLAGAGLDVVPVPVYYPEVTEILGRKVYRKLVDVPGELDLVNVFRRAPDIDRHVDDLIAKKPKAVWFQLGIVNDRAAMLLAAAGIKVVQNRCLMVDHRRYAK
jgi:uncharacterized protein